MTGKEWLAALERMAGGDAVALAQLGSLVTGHLARFGAYAVRDSWDDLCQEVLIKLLRSAREGRIQEPDAFVAFVGSVTRNAWIDWTRRNARHEASGSEEALERADASESLARAARETSLDLRADLERCLEGLPERQRQIVFAVYLEGRSYEEAAGALGLPLGTLKRHQTSGLKALRVCMGLEEAP